MSIRLYTKTGCAYSAGAKRLLDEKGMTYEEVNISDHPERREEMEKLSGRHTTPQAFFEGKPMGGYDELQELDRTKGLRTALLDAGNP